MLYRVFGTYILTFSLTLDMTDVILGLLNLYSHILSYPWYDRCYIGSLEPILSHSFLPLDMTDVILGLWTYILTFSLTLDMTDVILGLWNLYSHILSYPWYDRCYIGSLEPIFSHSLLPLIWPMLYWVFGTYIITFSLTLDMTDVIYGLWNLYSHILSYPWYDRCYIGVFWTYILIFSLTLDMTDVILGLWNLYYHILSYPWYDRCYIGSLEPIFSHSLLLLIWPMLYWAFGTYILTFFLTLDMTDVILGLWNLYSHILSYPWYDWCYIGSLEPIFSHSLFTLDMTDVYIGSLEPIFSHSLLPLIWPKLYWVFRTYILTFSLTLDRTDVIMGLWNL